MIGQLVIIHPKLNNRLLRRRAVYLTDTIGIFSRFAEREYTVSSILTNIVDVALSYEKWHFDKKDFCVQTFPGNVRLETCALSS